MLNKTKEIKAGVVLSYLLIVCNMLYGLFITPFILKYIGESAYGVYKTVSSISASLVIMDLGFSSTATRYIARYSATGEKEKKEANWKNEFFMIIDSINNRQVSANA